MRKIITAILLVLVFINGNASEAELESHSPYVASGISGQPVSGTLHSEKNPHRGWLWETEYEPYDTGWAVYLDNDLFSFRHQDQDYTGGLSLTVAGRRAKEYSLSLDPALIQLDTWTHFEGQHQKANRHLHSMELGFTVFTPKNIDDAEAQTGDRPYATLLFLSNTRESINMDKDTAWLSTFTLGVMGLPIVDKVQSQIHQVLGSNAPVGWNRQISDGGELTAKYSVARQQLFYFNYLSASKIELSSTIQASLGYITETSLGIAARMGQFETPWYSFRPQVNNYSEKAASLAGLPERADEFYAWGGINLHLRGYNAFLQGQFKNSEQTFSSSELRPILLDAWLGVTRQFASGWRISYLLRGQSSEVKHGQADRSVIWGGFIISKGW